MLSLGVAECRNVLALQNGATRVDERRVTTGSSGGGELGLLCAELNGLHALPVAPDSTGAKAIFALEEASRRF